MPELLTAIAPLAVANIAFFTLIYTMFKEQKKQSEQQHQTTKSIEHQVKNSHEINLRDDLDDKHSELIDMLKVMNHRLEIIDNTQVRHQTHIDKLWGKVHNLDRNNNNGG